MQSSNEEDNGSCAFELHVTEYLMHFSLFFFNHVQEGSIGHDLVIRPVPADVIHPMNVDGKTLHHVVFKREAAEADEQSDFGEYEGLKIFV